MECSITHRVPVSRSLAHKNLAIFFICFIPRYQFSTALCTVRPNPSHAACAPSFRQTSTSAPPSEQWQRFLTLRNINALFEQLRKAGVYRPRHDIPSPLLCGMQRADYTHHVSREERRLARREDCIEHALLACESRHPNNTVDVTRRRARCETVGRVFSILGRKAEAWRR